MSREDSSQVHIFDRGPNGIAFKKTFGRQGDAPGELIEIYHLYPFRDHLEILTSGRFARFSPEGRFLDEQRLPPRVFKDGAFCIGEKFLARISASMTGNCPLPSVYMKRISEMCRSS